MREMLESGIPAHHPGQGLGTHSELSEDRVETGQLSRGETNRLGQKLGGARTVSRGERRGQPWKVGAPSSHASTAIGPLAREAGPGLGAPCTQVLVLPKHFYSFLADMCMHSAGSLRRLHLTSLCSS